MSQRPTSNVPMSNVQRPNVQRPTSNVPTSNVQRPTSQRPTSNVQRPNVQCPLYFVHILNAGDSYNFLWKCILLIRKPLFRYKRCAS
ncbi:MAG: hypothetical protein DYG98_03890 [Haliscomenobacteraceae bacterium CHB4]|nr:hypothetical protein [Haliscomenobacteraceae bacterium CHB4]